MTALSWLMSSVSLRFSTWRGPDQVLRTSQLLERRAGEGRLRVSGEGFQITFSVEAHTNYLVLRLEKVVEPAPGTLMTFAFRLAANSEYVLTRLDYMTVPTDGERGMSWPWIWGRNTANPLGAFAIQAPRNDQEFDENLLQMWVEDGLPHPTGEWTIERARSWLSHWQQRFADQSCIVLGAKTRGELEQVTAWADSLKMKRVYLHTDTWRGEYWPYQHSYLRVNPEVFPGGEKDLNDYTISLREKGMGFAVHSTCMSIGRNDPDYVRDGVDPRLSRWVRGTLTEAVGQEAKTLYFCPAPGVRHPRMVRHVWAGPGTMPSWMDLKMFLVGDELVEAETVDHSRQDVWVLKGCRRGAWGKDARSHPAGTKCEGMVRPYRQVFVPDPDSTLFVETIQRWAEFCTRNSVDHLECDALEDHADKPWGVGKFSWLLSSALSLPSTSNTSSGSPLPFQVEYWFRGSRQVVANHARGGVAGGASLPLYAHSEIRQATGPYEILYKPGEMVGRGSSSFNVSSPWPMFGVTPEILSTQGLVPMVEDLLRDWRSALQTISPGCRKTLGKEYGVFRSPIGKGGNQPGTDVLFRPESVEGQSQITPLRLLGRSSGELNWGYGQEFGPIVPRQYLRVGESLQLANPWQAQEPEFLIRVMGELAGTNDEWQAPETAQTEDSILAAYEAGTTNDFSAHPLHSARHIWAAEAVENGAAMPGVVQLRRSFRVNLRKFKGARLYLQLDDEAVAYVNGKKVFSGGSFDQLQFVEVRNFRHGPNEVLIKATNAGGAGSVAAALHIQEGSATRDLASDGSWQARIGDGAWGAVADLGAYGASVWPKVAPQPAVVYRDLMPALGTIEPGEGHELTLVDDALQISYRNESSALTMHLKDRPAWAMSLDMSAARGVGCTVTGDGSGAVLVITIEGHGYRDYVIPIDFTGTRELQIPTGEVAWAMPEWSWRGHGRFRYDRIRKVRVGFGTVPAATQAQITVRDIRPLREVATEVRDLTIRIGGGRELVVLGAINSGQYLWYRGGDSLGIYDLNWNKLRDCEVRKQKFSAPKGRFNLQLTGAETGHQPWLETQFFVKGVPIVPSAPTPTVGN